MSESASARKMTGFLPRFDPIMATGIHARRRALDARLSSAIDQVYDNQVFQVCGSGSSPRASDGVVLPPAAAIGPSLCCNHGVVLPAPAFEAPIRTQIAEVRA